VELFGSAEDAEPLGIVDKVLRSSDPIHIHTGYIILRSLDKGNLASVHDRMRQGKQNNLKVRKLASVCLPICSRRHSLTRCFLIALGPLSRTDDHRYPERYSRHATPASDNPAHQVCLFRGVRILPSLRSFEILCQCVLLGGGRPNSVCRWRHCIRSSTCNLEVVPELQIVLLGDACAMEVGVTYVCGRCMDLIITDLRKMEEHFLYGIFYYR
jgi:hypothetical protein